MTMKPLFQNTEITQGEFMNMELMELEAEALKQQLKTNPKSSKSLYVAISILLPYLDSDDIDPDSLIFTTSKDDIIHFGPNPSKVSHDAIVRLKNVGCFPNYTLDCFSMRGGIYE